MLGHVNIAITLDTYSHLLPDMQEKAARAWRRHFGKLWREQSERNCKGVP